MKHAQEQLGKLREAHHTGKGAATLRERRHLEREAERQTREAEEQRQRIEKTVADLWDRYARELIAVENKPRTAAEKTCLWERRIKPALGDLKIRDVTAEDVGAVVRAPLRLDAAGQAVGGKAEAGNVYRLLHHLFRKALAQSLRPRELGNPLETITEPKTARPERLLAPGEVGALLKALATAGKNRIEVPQIVAVIRAAILTGAWISELLSLRWEDIRREEIALHLPDTKTGFSRRPLSVDTLAVLDSMERVPGSPFIFRSVKSTAKPLAYNTVEKAFRRIVETTGIENCTLHTIRHWYATATANTVSNPRIGMALTRHKSHSAYMNCLHGDKEQARALADRLAKLATELAAAEPNVISLLKARND